MKQALKIVLIVEAILCLLFCILGNIFENIFTSLFAFPFEQLGFILRFLSTSGAPCNIISIVLYCTFCLLPCFYLAFRMYKKKVKIYPEDGLLVLLSIILFVIIYLMINPAYIARHFGSFEILNTSKALLGIVVYSIIAGYLIIHELRIFKNSQINSIFKYLKIILYVNCVVLIFGIFGSGLTELISSFKNLSATNTNLGQNLNLSYIFLVLQYIVRILPLIFEIVIIFSGLDLINLLEENPYKEEVPETARRLGSICRYSVTIIMLSQIFVNVLLLILGSKVFSSNYTLSIPILSVMFALIAMVLASFFEQGKKLKEDNDMFI